MTSEVAEDLCRGAGFRGGPSIDVDGSLKLLDSTHFRVRKGAAWKHLVGECGMVASSEKFLVKSFLAGFMVKLMTMVIYFGIAHIPACTTPGNPEFAELINMEERHLPKCLLWLGIGSGVHGNLN